MNDKYLLADLEYALCTKLRPTFLVIADLSKDGDGSVEVMLSCIAFRNKSIQERVSMVFNMIKQYVPKILEERNVVVHCYDSTEIIDIIDNIVSD